MISWVSSMCAAILTAIALRCMARRSPLLVQATFALSFGFLWMLVNVVYIELSGGVYAIELLRIIGGGTAAATLAAYYALFVAAVMVVFSSRRLGALQAAWLRSIPDDGRVLGIDGFAIARVALLLLVIAVYAELVRGPVPLLAGMDRGAYAAIAGPAVNLLYRYEMYFCLVAGVLYANDVRNGLSPGRSVAGWSMGALVIAYVLMGHKFSGVFFNLLLFLVPVSLLRLSGVGQPRRISIRHVAVVVLLGALFTATVSRYITQFTNATAVKFYLQQRLLIQQGELWWSAHQRVVDEGLADRRAAREAVFVTPVVETGVYTSNTAATYLMYRELGSPALRVISSGFLYTGASPTILVELFGVWGGAVVMFLTSLLYAALLYLFLRAVALRDLLASVFVCYVFGLFHNVVVGGNAAELLKGNLVLKCVAMSLALLAASELRRRRSPGSGPEAPMAVERNAT